MLTTFVIVALLFLTLVLALFTVNYHAEITWLKEENDRLRKKVKTQN